MGRSGRMGEEFRPMEGTNFGSRGNSGESPSGRDSPGNPSPSQRNLTGSVLDFARCVRADGTAYGTGGTCRLGTEQEKPDEEKVARVKHALSCSFEEFLKTYERERKQKFEETAEEQANKIFQMDGVKGVENNEDFMFLVNARNLPEIHSMVTKLGQDKGEKAAFKLITTDRVFLGLKWGLLNKREGVTPGTLKLIWSGMNPNASVKDAFGVSANMYPRRKVVVGEHVVPTRELPRLFMRGVIKGDSPKELLKSFLQRNLLSSTSAPEELKLAKRGFDKKLPEVEETFSRYNEAKIKLLPRKLSSDGENLRKSADKAKKAGWTFDEWAASVIDI